MGPSTNLGGATYANAGGAAIAVDDTAGGGGPIHSVVVTGRQCECKLSHGGVTLSRKVRVLLH